jgi:ParB-like chromosome segregation protein Spo0J
MTKRRAANKAKMQELVWLAIDQLVPHPLNANVMSPELMAKLRENIGRTRRYPPVVVRRLANGTFQVLDGWHRVLTLGELGELGAWCLIWDVTDQDALLLLATLNRLHGEDVPGKRAALIAELQQHETLARLALLLPESEAELTSTLELVALDFDSLLADLTTQAERAGAEGPQLFIFAVDPADAPAVEQALEHAAAGLSGKNRRGQAFVLIAARYLEAS